MSELIIETEESNLPLKPKLDLDTFKSILYWQNVKPDTQIKFFRVRKKVEVSDIYSLNERLNAKISTHTVQTYIASIDFILSDGNIRSYGSWAEFEREKWDYINQKVLSINITWDLTFSLKNFNLPQKHTLKVKIGNSIAPKDMFQMMFTSDEPSEILESRAEGLVKVDFINQLISNELINIVTEWHDGLKSVELEKGFIKFLEEKQKYISTFVANFTPVFLIYFVYLFQELLCNTFGSTKALDLISFQKTIFIFSLVFVVGILLGKLFSNWLNRRIDKFDYHSGFFITQGDKDYFDELKNNNNKTKNEIIKKVVLAIITASITVITKFILENYIING